MLVQAAQAVQNHPGPLGDFFRRLKGRTTHNVAVVASARKLAILAWHVLTTGQPYRYAIPATTQAKLAKLPGGGRTIKSLPEVFASENVPAAAPAPAGETRHLAAIELQDFADSLQRAQVVPRPEGRRRILTKPTGTKPTEEAGPASPDVPCVAAETDGSTTTEVNVVAPRRGSSARTSRRRKLQSAAPPQSTEGTD